MISKEWDLGGKVALLTVDYRGWAPYLASALAEAGADVAVAGLPREARQEAVEAVKAHGRRGIGIPVDVTRRQEVRRAVAETLSHLGRLDILVNGSQAEFGKPFADVTAREWDRVMALNVRSAFLCCQEAGRVMMERGGGRIVNIISGLAERGLWNQVAYCASQGAAMQLTRALGLEWSRCNIRVNAIGTGWLTLEELAPEEAQKEQLVRYIPSRRKGHPRELGPLLVYLCSDACDYVAGACVYVDGGVMAHA